MYFNKMIWVYYAVECSGNLLRSNWEAVNQPYNQVYNVMTRLSTRFNNKNKNRKSAEMVFFAFLNGIVMTC